MKHFRTILGIAISVALILYVLREVPPSDVIGVLSKSNPWLFAVSVICATMIFPLRARRWRTILDPVYPKLPFSPLWQATAVGMAINNVVPARAGEVARAYVLTQKTAVPFSASIASLAIDRVFDSIVLLVLGFCAILSPAFPSDTTIAGRSLNLWAMIGVVGVLGVLLVLYALVYFPNGVLKAFELLTRKLPPHIETKGRVALMNFRDGLSVLRHPKHVAAIFGWTFAHWLLNAFAFWVAMKAVGMDAPFSAAVLVQTIIAMGVAVPSSPGFFGVFEGVALVGLTIYGVPKNLAASWAIGFHLLSFIPITVIGLVYFSRIKLNLGALRASTST